MAGMEGLGGSPVHGMPACMHCCCPPTDRPPIAPAPQVAAVKHKIMSLKPVLNIYVGQDSSGRSGPGDFVCRGAQRKRSVTGCHLLPPGVLAVSTLPPHSPCRDDRKPAGKEI